MRDDFDEKTRDVLARRVGFLCSNPKCKKPTSGPQTNSAKSISIGVAAHVAAASPGGKRYDDNQSTEQRKSANNGIWLCQSCSKLIDSDAERYTIALLTKWKSQAETSALRELEESDRQGELSETDPLETLIQLLEKPENRIKVQGDEYIRHRYDTEFVIKKGNTIN